MRRGWIAVLMISALMLAGCGSRGAEERFDRFRQTLEAADGIAVTAEVTAISGDDVTAFTLSCATAEEGYEVSVTEPELLAGVRAHLRQGDATLEFDNIVLPMGTLSENGLSPLMALPCVIDAACEGHVDLLWTEDDRLVTQLILDDTTTVRLYLDEALTPVYAEIAAEDTTVVQCSILTWQLNEREAQDESDDSNLG